MKRDAVRGWIERLILELEPDRVGGDPEGRRIAHHGGTIEGGRALVLLFPDSKVVVAVLTNALVDVREADAQRLGALFIR